MPLPRLTAFVLTLIFAVGCGGSDNNPTPTPKPKDPDKPTTLGLKGIAADGYLRNATVCLDTNNDGNCAGEASATTTGEGGKFTLQATAADFEKYPVITQVVVGTIDEDTITEDNPQGTPVAAGGTYTLSAPPGSVATTDDDGDGVLAGTVFVSPITTLVQQARQEILANNPDSADALTKAKAQVAEQLGTDPEALTTDYVAAQKTDGDADEDQRAKAARLHTTAKVVADLLANTEADVAAAVTKGSITSAQSADALKIALNRIAKQLEKISAQVKDVLDTLDTKNAAEHQAAVAKAIANIAQANDTVDADNISSVVDAAKATTTSTTAAEVIQRQGGIWVFGVEGFEEDGTLEAEVWADNLAFTPASGDTPAKSVDDCYTVNITTGEIAASKNDEFTLILLTKNGWAEYTKPAGDDCYLTYAITDDGGVQGTAEGETLTVSAEARQIELKDQSIAGLMGLYDTVSDVHWPYLIKKEAAFSSTATGFVLTGTEREDEWYSMGSKDGIGNNRVGYHLGHDNFTQNFSSLDFIVHAEGAKILKTDSTIDETLAFIDVGRIDLQHDRHLSLFLSGTTATYFTRQYNPAKSQMESKALGTTTFSFVTVNGVRLLQVPTIAEIREFELFGGTDEVDGGQPFLFAEYQNIVRHVYFEPEERESFSVLALNKDGRDDLIKAFNADRFSIRAHIPPNTPALASLVGAAFSQTTDTYFFTTRWSDGGERLFWGVGEAKTNPNDGTGTRSFPYPFPLTGSPYFTNKFEVATLNLLDGLFVYTPTSHSQTFVDRSEYYFPVDPALSVVYAAESTGEGNSKVITGCVKQGSDVRQGEFACQPSLEEDGQFFASLSRSPIEAKALELTASAQTIAFDPKEFVGKTFYALEFDGSDIDRVAITLNDDAAKSVSVVGSGISAADLTYEFIDYGLKVSGTLTEDGEAETVSNFVLLRKHYAADQVFTVCWKDKEDAVSTESHAVYACANDPASERMQNIITFSKDKADALEEAGVFTPSS